MIEDIVLKVITVEDISAAAAVELVSLFNMIINRAPSILPVSQCHFMCIIFFFILNIEIHLTM